MSRLGHLLRIEVIKARKRPALWITLGVFAFFTVAAVMPSLMRAMQGGGPGPPFALPWIWRAVLQPPINMGPFFIGVAMILLFAPEFGWKTARQNVIDGLAKEHFFFGKVIAFVFLVAAFFIVPIIAGVAASVISPEPTGTFARTPELNHMSGYGLALALWGSVGFLLAATIRAAGGAMGIMLLYFLVENMLVSLVSLWNAALETYLDYLPTQLFDTMTRNEFYYPDELARVNASRAQIGQPPLDYPDFGVVAVAVLAWVALFLGVAFVSTRKRDL
ncbi:MAG: ABC transporter permease [Gemmatimonadetes bacterium]|nr:ABC transporter permease [Gemmatimonadota bacterium]